VTRTGLVLLMAMLAGLAQAQPQSDTDYHQLVLDYVNKIENIYNGNWAYSYTVDDKLEGETRTIRRDNSLPFLEREQLVSVNGMPPSEERLQEHRERRERRLRRRQNDNDDDDDDDEEEDEKQRFLDMLVPESIHFQKREDELLYLGFRAMEERRRKVFENIEGTLIIDTEREFIKELQVNVIEPFSPFFFGSIEDGHFSLRFELNDGVPMQSGITWQLDGSAFIFRDLDADQQVEWKDIERI